MNDESCRQASGASPRPRFQVFATDYDGTLAHHANVSQAAIEALERLRTTGRTIIMVTGREIEELKQVFSRLDLFDLVVGENGALIYEPASDEIRLLHEPPPPRFAQALRERGVSPLSVGHVVVAMFEPHETIALELIKAFTLELEIIFNKGSVMILPTGVNKATGLAAALNRLGLAKESVVGVGDAENDHAFLQSCACGVADANALPSLKQHADLVTTAGHGQGVAELIDLLIATDLRDVAPAKWRAAR